MNKAMQIIEQFIDKYPDEEFGCGHIVFSDFNLEDNFIEFCIKQGENFMQGLLPEMEYSVETTPKAISVLKQLLEIPEDDRIIEDD